MKDYTQPILATGATGAAWVASANEILGFAVTLLTLAWWIRLWLKKPDCAPPPMSGKPAEKNESAKMPALAVAACLALAAGAGCQSYSADQTLADGSYSTVTARSFLSFQKIAKLNTDAKTGKAALGGYDSGTELEKLSAVVEATTRAAVEGAVKAAK